MKRISFVLVFVSILFSCSNDDDSSVSPNILGTWQLTAVLVDPGDGSGTFVEVDDELKRLLFLADGTVISLDSSICGFTPGGITGVTTYDIIEQQILTECCGFASCIELTIYYEFEGENLILSYPCIEACQEKYKKIN